MSRLSFIEVHANGEPFLINVTSIRPVEIDSAVRINLFGDDPLYVDEDYPTVISMIRRAGVTS